MGAGGDILKIKVYLLPAGKRQAHTDMTEIERKFLVTSTAYREQAHRRMEMVQGFLSRNPERTVRIRRMGDLGWITVKGRTTDGGTTRSEWEYEIPAADAEALLSLCLPEPIRKVRYEVPFGGHVFEVDEFGGANSGLVLAEIELKSSDETFERPDWLGREVTGLPEYYNSQLSKKPYTRWND